eukprot:XP_011679964.1 PREDICTED: uncharacterized protein LOC100891743 isoform X2 [Strongylocentrotus purpuratus]
MAEAMNIGDKLQQMADNEGGKRSAEENAATNQNNKRPRGGDGTKVSFRLLIPSSNAGGIIGKEGLNINQLRKKHPYCYYGYGSRFGMHPGHHPRIG